MILTLSTLFAQMHQRMVQEPRKLEYVVYPYLLEYPPLACSLGQSGGAGRTSEVFSGHYTKTSYSFSVLQLRSLSNITNMNNFDGSFPNDY